jgi:hypothetical protein
MIGALLVKEDFVLMTASNIATLAQCRLRRPNPPAQAHEGTNLGLLR